jgi:hypothetical protein
MSEATSIYGHYETRGALVQDVQLAILAVVKEIEEPSSARIAELVTDIVIIPLLEEVSPCDSSL